MIWKCAGYSCEEIKIWSFASSMQHVLSRNNVGFVMGNQISLASDENVNDLLKRLRCRILPQGLKYPV